MSEFGNHRMEQPDPADTLPWTGERLVTTCAKPIAYEHLHRYAIACSLAAGKRVLDIASGEGYGSRLLARVACEVLGVDNDPAAVAHAQRKYRRGNLRFVEGGCTDIPCEDGSIDLVASFETIEHIDAHDVFLQEIKRVLAPGGILIISSPDRTEYNKVSSAANPFHQHELLHDEFAKLVGGMFAHRVTGRQRLVSGSWIAPDGSDERVAAATFHGGFSEVGANPGVHRGLYSIAVCSDSPLPQVQFGVFEDFRASADTWHLLERFDTPADVARVLSELEQKAARLQELETQVVEQEKQSQRDAAELLDAQWELLSLREASLRNISPPDTMALQLAEAATRATNASAERDQMREMLKELQQDLEAARIDLRNAHEALDALKPHADASLRPQENPA